MAIVLLNLGMMRHVILLSNDRVDGRMATILGHLGHGMSNTGRRTASVVTWLCALGVSRPIVVLRQRVRHSTHIVWACPPIDLRLCRHIELGRESIVGRIEMLLGMVS